MLRLPGFLLAVLLLATLLLAVSLASAASAQALRVDRVAVASSSLKPGEAPVPVELVAWFSRPPVAGAVPAVLLMHGCSGPGRNLPQWRQVLDGMGLAVLSLDSFAGRGLKEICSDFTRLSDRERLVDALAGLDWLASRPDILGGRIALIGFSHGGGIALDAAALPPRDAAPRGFRAAIAFYPACRLPRRQQAEYRVPLSILIGDADDWTPAAACRDLVARSRGLPIELEVYPEARHAFDVAGLAETLRPDVQNRNSPTGRGSVVGENPAARAAAIDAVRGFLKRHL
ncbi:dienelactone hydrolase [Stella humosa]|uniref:Dienelactone hydrolase n=1 Tax=Stella humosa TaxID=94 RepID=A0A3N1LHS4_9PROT|nr:dienelactone hydrolase family protein [Stella humosa]ROP90902.1 dienelactone hydrolase [Stella humosa]BBK34748.1 hypothetical protein STHU_53820 [Stella humosa]